MKLYDDNKEWMEVEVLLPPLSIYPDSMLVILAFTMNNVQQPQMCARLFPKTTYSIQAERNA